jgi:hypothetical protein
MKICIPMNEMTVSHFTEISSHVTLYTIIPNTCFKYSEADYTLIKLQILEMKYLDGWAGSFQFM